MKNLASKILEVARTSDGLVLSQWKFTLDILKDSGMLGSWPTTFPIEQNLKIDKDESQPKVLASVWSGIFFTSKQLDLMLHIPSTSLVSSLLTLGNTILMPSTGFLGTLKPLPVKESFYDAQVGWT